MDVTKAELAQMRQRLFGRARDQRAHGHPEFRCRPISEAWMLADRVPAYKTAVANVAYIWRDDTPADRFGPMPASFGQRRHELRGAGLMLPGSAPIWATKDFTIWKEADEATAAVGHPDAIAGWHLILQIPNGVPHRLWKSLAVAFIQRRLARRGCVTAWAIHALEGEEGWIVEPHIHLVVTERRWRHDRRHGRRLSGGGVGQWGSQRSLEQAWRQACQSARWNLFSTAII